MFRFQKHVMFKSRAGSVVPRTPFVRYQTEVADLARKLSWLL